MCLRPFRNMCAASSAAGFVEVVDSSLVAQAAEGSGDGKDKKQLPLQGSLLSSEAGTPLQPQVVVG